jgi:hypothetical protein
MRTRSLLVVKISPGFVSDRGGEADAHLKLAGLLGIDCPYAGLSPQEREAAPDFIGFSWPIPQPLRFLAKAAP